MHMLAETVMTTHSDNRTTRKTRELTEAPKAPIMEVQLSDHRPNLLSFSEKATRFMAYAFMILLLVVVFSNIASDWLHQPIMIDPLIVPKTMEDQGYTGSVAANRLADEMIRIEQ